MTRVAIIEDEEEHAKALQNFLKQFGAEANKNVTDAKVLKTNKILRIVYWSVVAALVIAVIVVFFTWGLPLLKQAFEIV